jgi:hypothetical protein
MTDLSSEALQQSGHDEPSIGIFRTCIPTIRMLILALLVCVVAPSSLIAIHIKENPKLSPIDEITQFDYVSRMAQGSMPRLGQFLLPSTLKLLSCTGTALVGTGNPPCPGSSNPRRYVGGGYQYEAQQPPTYYAITVPLRWVGVHIFGMRSLTAARASGALWVSAALFLLWMAGRLLGLSERRLVAAMLILASAPVVIYQSSIVTNDAPGLFAGALMALLGVLAWKSPGKWTAPVLFVSAFVVTTFKLNDILAVFVVSSVLAFQYVSCMSEQYATVGQLAVPWFQRWWRSGGMMLAGGVVATLAWVIINRSLNLINPKTLPSFGVLRLQPVSLALIARESVSMFSPLTGSYDPFRTDGSGNTIGTMLSVNLQQITAPVIEYFLIAGGLAGLFIRDRKWPHWLGLSSLLFLYLGGLLVGIGLWRTYNVDPSVSGRYGLAVAPLLVLALVAALRGRWVVNGILALSVAVYGLTFLYLFAT